jgi:hypothetical protein
MNHSPNDRRSPLAPFPGEPILDLYVCAAETLRTRCWRFLVALTGKGFVQVSLNKR